VIDQFVSSAEDKWREVSRLGLLLPHGYEGQGPEHSSARIERYLQLCADDNMQVANVTTPGQYFHLLRRQMRQPRGKPLVLFTPKSLLRFPASFSPIGELSGGAFRTVIDDGVADRAPVSRVIVCSGKVFYDLAAARDEKKASNVAIVRVEQLYPFPSEPLRSFLGSYSGAKDVVWVQEESKNMGAWTFVSPLLEDVLPSGAALRYAGRGPSAAVATGNAGVHKRELAAFLEEALEN
jgi:2-oxoglutarate dehydrogenase E1 component